MEKPEPDTQLQFLDVAALQSMFKVGRSKARLMMDALPSIRVGNKDYISQKALNGYLTANGGIPISWPKRRR
ncbi:hypothetical protein HUE67_11320 [Bifidobacterium longum subsp. infantis]|uniref:DNA-binding protein n=1 Tax=Bifidobacterium longum subsp. infantis TaxID=1682 RepID=A0A7D4XVS7_BIFLI|nr:MULTISPECIES: hypothetical protein [Bifidobacterium]KAB1945223.1 hypothetical protein F8277_03720 [Bifidobacterium longum subsp. infantis]KEY28745.1 hypothetical protein EK3BL_04815 [Bifidobacterium longum subsp. infantis EK3]MED7619327.1 hypothetical protein [Bifidobacterium longum subsp. infantis]NQX51545.1 hypothetical protein [Bifidobacterium longum subsp. infantis]QKY12671.1 hypothetical protein EE567_001455 [Bifidobacterium longum subsp. infantis]